MPFFLRQLTLVRISVVVLGLFSTYFTATRLWPQDNTNKYHTYIGDDFPAVMDIPDVHSSVMLETESTLHYQLNGSVADEEWSVLLPKPVILVRLGPHYRPFAISMIHTLHCLDKLRHSILQVPTTQIGRKHVEHCANYIRKAILCAADTTLESTKGDERDMNDLQPTVRRCRDWTAVYKEIQNNHEAFVKAGVEVPYV